MPEGDTVHQVAEYLRQRLIGVPIDAANVPSLPGLDLEGRRITQVATHGKHLFFVFEEGGVLRSHLGMHGSWHRYPRGQAWKRPARQASIELHAGGQVYVLFQAEEVEWFRRGAVRDRQIDRRLGPDLMASDPSIETILLRARQFLEPETIVADLLLDQRIAAGIGNVYKSEVLFLEAVLPRRPIGLLDDEAVERMFQTARRMLLHNAGPGPRVTTRELPRRIAEKNQGPTPPGVQRPTATARLWVYGRSGRPCRACGAPIRSERMGRHWRSTYWCPRCQT